MPNWPQKPPAGSLVDWDNPLTLGLVNLWMLNEGVGTKVNDLVAQNNGTLGASTAWSAGDKGSTITTPALCSSPSSVTTNRITVAARFNTLSTARGDILTCWNNGASASQFDLLKGVTTGKAQFFICNGTTNFNATGATTLVPGTWYDAVGTYDGTTILIYLNGKQDGTTSTTQTLATSSLTPIRLLNDALGFPFDGRLDRAAIWNRVLSAAEIYRLYNDPYAMIVKPSSTRFAFSAAARRGLLLQRRRMLTR